MLLDLFRNEFVILRFQPGEPGQALQPSVTRVPIVPPVTSAGMRGPRSIRSKSDRYRALLGNHYFELSPDGHTTRHVALAFPDARVMAVRQDIGERRGASGAPIAPVPGAIVRYVRLPPYRPDRINLGVTVVRDGGSEPRSMRAELRPIMGDQKFLVAAMGATTILGSPLANTIASLSRPIEDELEYARRIVRDPIFAGGEALGWLLLSVLVSALAAAWAHRQAGRRLSSRNSVWAWTVAVFLLGPVGAIWMRLTIPWVAIEDGRAVNLESSAWPDPARKGTEVFA